MNYFSFKINDCLLIGENWYDWKLWREDWRPWFTTPSARVINAINELHITLVAQ